MALLSNYYLDCVVALGYPGSDGKTFWGASGFLYGWHVGDKSEEVASFRTYLVTNRHVIKDVDKLFLRFNPEGSERAREFNVTLNPEGRWQKWFAPADPKIDVVVIPLSVAQLKEQKIRFEYFQSNNHVADRAKCNELGIAEGDGVYLLGFPMGLVGENRNYVIARSGVIARIRDFLGGFSNEYLVDASVFPGNSGGPVILRPEETAIHGSKAQLQSLLIGVVKEYLTYRDVAVSNQTGRTRVVFEENSGLSVVVPIDYVHEAIAKHIASEESPEENVTTAPAKKD